MIDCEKCIHYCVCVVNSYCHDPCGYYEQKRPHGEWIDLSDGWQEGTFMCSSCQMEFVLLEGTPEDNEYNFCPNCGADMRQQKGGDME